ncbi:MAG: hypothetical protein HDR30_06245, partial [Lachnospiraceae bacterium]|nr:hypothetical protein [Lachnospiraceae bacterium]
MIKGKNRENTENFIRKFWREMLVIIMAGIFLTACGNKGSEEEELELQTEVQSEPQTETQSEPLPENDSDNFNDDKESEVTLSDITWDDYNSGNTWETWMYFSFSDGTVVDIQSPYMSIVQKVDYVDITGDGKDEVLIYRYFANTATEYTLVNFFQIEEKNVTEISPEVELEELA